VRDLKNNYRLLILAQCFRYPGWFGWKSFKSAGVHTDVDATAHRQVEQSPGRG